MLSWVVFGEIRMSGLSRYFLTTAWQGREEGPSLKLNLACWNHKAVETEG